MKNYLNNLKRRKHNSIDLRPGQRQAYINSFQMWAEGLRPLTVLPTGYGKTLLMGAMAYAVKQEYDERTVIICGSKELAEQTADTLSEWFPRMSVGYNFSGSRLQNKEADIIVSLPVSLKHIDPENTGLLLFDEAHHAVADSWYDVLDQLEESGVFIGGMTATPIRSDAQSLTRIFDALSINMQLSEAEHEGFLIKPQLHYHEVNDKDKSAMFKTALDYAGKSGKVLVFCDGIEHAEQCHEFVEREHKGEGLSVVLHSKMSDRLRKVSLDKFAAGGPARICFQDNILREGYDNCEITTIVIMKSVKSILVLLQMLGRVTRPISAPVGTTPEQRQQWIKNSGKSETHVVYFCDKLASYIEPLAADILKPWEPPKIGESETYLDHSKRRETDLWKLNREAVAQQFKEFDLYNSEFIKTGLLEIGSVADLIDRIADRMYTLGGLHRTNLKQEAQRQLRRMGAQVKAAIELLKKNMTLEQVIETYNA